MLWTPTHIQTIATSAYGETVTGALIIGGSDETSNRGNTFDGWDCGFIGFWFLDVSGGGCEMREQLYRYTWGNNEKRATMKGRTFRILARSNDFNSRLAEFIDNGQREVISGNAVKKV